MGERRGGEKKNKKGLKMVDFSSRVPRYYFDIDSHLKRTRKLFCFQTYFTPVYLQRDTGRERINPYGGERRSRP